MKKRDRQKEMLVLGSCERCRLFYATKILDDDEEREERIEKDPRYVDDWRKTRQRIMQKMLPVYYIMLDI